MPTTPSIISQVGKWIFNKSIPTPKRSYDFLDQPLSIHDIRVIIDRERTVEVGSYIPWVVSNIVMSAAVGSWKDMCPEAFSEIVTYMKGVVETVANEMFCQLQPKVRP